MICFKKWLSKIVKVGSYNKIKNFLQELNALSELEVLKFYGYLV